MDESSYMFDGCENLVGGNGTTYDSSNIYVSYAHIDEADVLAQLLLYFRVERSDALHGFEPRIHFPEGGVRDGAHNE